MKTLKKKEVPFAVANFSQFSDDAGLTPRESAMVLGIGLSTYWAWLKQGRITARRIGRTTRTSVGTLRRIMAGG
jgi:excisionase family DNA binding protein